MLRIFAAVLLALVATGCSTSSQGADGNPFAWGGSGSVFTPSDSAGWVNGEPQNQRTK